MVVISQKTLSYYLPICYSRSYCCTRKWHETRKSMQIIKTWNCMWPHFTVDCYTHSLVFSHIFTAVAWQRIEMTEAPLQNCPQPQLPVSKSNSSPDWNPAVLLNGLAYGIKAQTTQKCLFHYCCTLSLWWKHACLWSPYLAVVIIQLLVSWLLARNGSACHSMLATLFQSQVTSTQAKLAYHKPK
jgi:hypothetical protein